MEKTKVFLSRLAELAGRAFRQLGEVFTKGRRGIRFKLLVSYLILALVPLVILGVISYGVTSNSLMARAFENLEAVRANKVFAVEGYLYKSQSDMNTLLETVASLRQEAFDLLRSVRTIKKGQIEGYFSDRLNDVQALSVSPTAAAALMEFESAGQVSGPEWKAVEQTYNPWFAKYIEALGYIDLLLISQNGQVLYSVEKSSDMGQNLIKGMLKDSPVGKAYQRALSAPVIQDFQAYEPSGGVPAGFVAAPIKVDGETKGVVMVQIPVDQINAIMQERTGLGETGETYLVGSGKLFRSDSRFVEDSTILDETYLVDTEATKDALAGKTGEEIMKDYRGRQVLSAYAPLEIQGLQWIIVAEISVAEAFTPSVEGREEDFLTTFKEAHGYYDLYLLYPDGHLFYTVEREADYQTNMLTGPYKNSNLSRLIAEVKNTKEFALSDFQKYSPAKDAPAAFAAQPLVHEDHIELIVAVQLSLDHINTVMQERAGLGDTGETYLVGSDKLWRNNSNFLRQLGVVSTVLNPKTKVDTKASRSALDGKSGTEIIDDYRGTKVLSSWSSISIKEPGPGYPQGVKWAMISEIDLSEVQSPARRMALYTAAAVAGVAILVVLGAFLVAGGLTTQVRHIMELFGKIGMGDFEARAEVSAGDELGTMATSLNAMLDNTLALIQTREDRDAMESSVMKLLEEISGLAEGDLTGRAEVTTETTGAIADSFNVMTEQLSRVVKDVKDASVQVSSTSQEVKTSTENLAEISEAQAVQISDAVAAINEMATSIQQVAENATQSATVSQQATVNAKEGAEAVQSTNKSMSSIRENVQETAGAIKRLGESSQEIGNIVQLINDIADRTSILALNASIQAAMAGEAGRGFAVVAEEVQRLAERSTNATKQIDTLVKNIQGEISEAGISMEESIQQVVKGSALAEGAYDKLEEIESVATRLAELIQSISMAADQQARASENISKTMEEVGDVSTQTSAASRQTAVSMENMAETSDQLLSSVAAFKLAEEVEEREEEEVKAEEAEGTDKAEVNNNGA